MSGNTKRNIVVATMAVLVCAAVGLNWKYSGQEAAQQAEDDAPRPAAQPQKPSKKESRKNAGIPDDVAELIAESVEDVCGEDGFAHMGKLSNLLMKKQPDFDPRNYGFSKLSKLIKSMGRFDWKTEGADNSEYFVRDTQRADK